MKSTNAMLTYLDYVILSGLLIKLWNLIIGVNRKALERVA